VRALSPSAVIGLQDALAGEAQATRVRQLATPSWLSTRRRAGRRPGARRPFPLFPRPPHDSVSNLEPATATGSVGFFSLALCAGAVVKQDDFVARAASLGTTALGSLRTPGEGRRDLAPSPTRRPHTRTMMPTRTRSLPPTRRPGRSTCAGGGRLQRSGSRCSLGTTSRSAARDSCSLTKGAVCGSSLDGPLTCELDETGSCRSRMRPRRRNMDSSTTVACQQSRTSAASTWSMPCWSGGASFPDRARVSGFNGAIAHRRQDEVGVVGARSGEARPA